MKLSRILTSFLTLGILLFFFAPGKAVSATGAFLTLDPAVKTATVGDVFPVNIVLNTNNNAVTGISAIVLYESAKVQVVDVNGQAATTISTGSGTFASPTVTYNTVNLSSAQIRLDMSNSATPFTGQGTYGTFYLKALSPGTTSLAFSFNQGGTTGSTVSSGSPPTNILSSVSGATYTILAAATASGMPTPSPSSLPSSGVDTPTFSLLFSGLAVMALGIFFLKPGQRPA